MFFIGVLIYVAAEIASFVLVVEQIGLLWALLILIAVSALGPFIVRRVGLSVLVRTQDRLARGEVPTRELLDGLMILIGGVMICVPGFVGDALGMLLMIGPVRHLVTRVSGHGLARRVQRFRTGRWTIIDARSRSVRDDVAPTAELTRPEEGPHDAGGD
ncbi:MAG: FxsA family protein [Acidimicrobiales bacterium]